MIKFVQIVDGKVIAEFSCLQDPEHQSGVIEVNDDDPRYIAFVKSQCRVEDWSTPA